MKLYKAFSVVVIMMLMVLIIMAIAIITGVEINIKAILTVAVIASIGFVAREIVRVRYERKNI